MRFVLIFLFCVKGYGAWVDQIPIFPFSPRDLIFGAQNKELDVEALIAERYLQDDFLVFDVGANAGIWSCMALHYHPSLRIIAF